MSSREKHTTFYLSAILALSVFLRFWRLDDIPAEMWGDVTEGYKFARQVLHGDFYWRFIFGGDGPLFSYLVALLSLPLGLSFLTMKLATVVVGVLLIVAVYFLGRSLINQHVGLAAAFFLSISKWAIIYSRMAKPHISAALFATLSLITLYLAMQKKKTWWWIFTGVSLGLGMYTQSAFWGVPIATLILVAFSARRVPKKKVAWGLLTLLLIAAPLGKTLLSRPSAYINRSSFFGEKLIPKNQSFSWVIGHLTDNMVKNFLAFHVKGDVVFRNNPPRAPHLDILTGFIFLIGIVTIPRALRPWFWIPFFAFQIPSLLDLNFFGETANAGRTIALLPIVFLATGNGAWTMYRFLRENVNRQLIMFVGVTTMIIITVMNWKQVFIDYPQSLPNHNVPFGRIIAETINQLPTGTDVVLVGCCWSNGDPEPDGVRFRLMTSRNFTYIPASLFSCSSLVTTRPVLIVTDPHDQSLATVLSLCSMENLGPPEFFRHPSAGAVFLSYRFKNQ